MLERIAREAGLRTGLYTSPHLVRFSERIQIDGEPIGDDAFASALGRVLGDAPAELTFFETLTLAAFIAFEAARVDVAVLEVGLGGRLDATNIVDRPLATSIVSITEGLDGRWLEHADFLGSGVATIAREKAGIAKRDVPLVLGPLGPEARAAVIEAAAAAGAHPIWELPREEALPDARVSRIAFDRAARRVTLPSGDARVLEPRLAGDHQLDNAVVAAVTAGLGLRAPSLDDAIARGIAATAWPGRLERFVFEERHVWLDCAHNLESARALERSLSAILDPAPASVLVFGALADKPWEPVLALLAPRFSERVYTSPPGRAAAPLDGLRRVAPGLVIPEPLDAFRVAVRAVPPGGAVLVTGSIYLVGRVRSLLSGIAPDPAMGL